MVVIKICILVSIVTSSLVFCVDTVNRYLDNRDIEKLERIKNIKK